jgi:hypothetical protein
MPRRPISTPRRRAAGHDCCVLIATTSAALGPLAASVTGALLIVALLAVLEHLSRRR